MEKEKEDQIESLWVAVNRLTKTVTELEEWKEKISKNIEIINEWKRWLKTAWNKERR